MYLVTNCVSSANCLIILEQLENLISSLDESPAHISNKLPQARQRRFYPSHQISAVQDTLLNLSKGKKKGMCVCVVLRRDARREIWGNRLHLCMLSLWFPRSCVQGAVEPHKYKETEFPLKWSPADLQLLDLEKTQQKALL